MIEHRAAVSSHNLSAAPGAPRRRASRDSSERGTDAGFGQCRQALVHGSVRPYNEASGRRARPPGNRTGRLTPRKAGTVRSASGARPGRAQRKGAPPEKQARGGVAGSAGSRPGSSLPGVALPAVVQPVRRDRGSVRPLHGLRTLARRHCSFAPPVRSAQPRSRWLHRRTQAPQRLRYRDGRDPRRVRPASISLLRSIGWSHPGASSTVERPHPSHEVPPGPRGGRRARTTPRPRADGSIRLPDARCGDRATAVQAAAPLPRIQPCRGAGRHCPRRAESGTTTEGPHRPAPLAAASQAEAQRSATRT